MSVTIKDIIVESCNRANLVPRKRSIPADMLESSYRLLKGILQKYNFSNYINFARGSMEIIPTDTIITLDGSDCNSISSVSWILNENTYNEMRFLQYEQFMNDSDIYTYSWKYNDNNEIELYLKPLFVNGGKKISVYFNKSLNYELNQELKIPEIYIELFTAALTYKLAMTYPRTDPSQVTLLKAELEELERNVKSLISSNKILTREPTNISNRADFLSGNFLFR